MYVKGGSSESGSVSLQVAAVEGRPLKVSELLAAVNRGLEDEFSNVDFVGELFQITRAESGHFYATLKDADGQLAIAVWRSNAERLRFTPMQGDRVVCRGSASIFPKTGRFQMIVSSMRLDGEGDLQRRFEQLRSRLELEGLFDDTRKRRIPFFPKAVGVVTSATGSVIQDIEVTIRRRMPGMPLFLIGVPVQGVGAADAIAAAIRSFNSLASVDVLIVGRGGGSLEDLWAFNEEVVVRAVFSSRIPVISAVGHETDVTLADLVADLRAPTPTAAAELAVPLREDLSRRLAAYEVRMKAMERIIMPLSQWCDDLSFRLKAGVYGLLQRGSLQIQSTERGLALLEPRQRMAATRERLLFIQRELLARIIGSVSSKSFQLAEVSFGLQRLNPVQQFLVESQRLDVLSERLSRVIHSELAGISDRLNFLAVRFAAGSPDAILARGYGYVTRGGKVVNSASTVVPGDVVDVNLHQGGFSATVGESFVDRR